MNEAPPFFPLPADAELRAQAEAMARAAWLMGGPGTVDPPANPIEEDMDETQTPSD